MEYAIVNALSEITLVVFTTLGPASAVACWIAATPLLRFGINNSERRSYARRFAIPLIVASAGLIASATHLGNPANALYVFTGIGRSPLSNEVICAVAFLGCAAIFWVVSFARKHYVLFLRAWCVVLVATGTLFILSVALAYNVDTIITWYLPEVPVSIFLNALFAGPIFGIAVLGVSEDRASFLRVLIAASTCAFVANVANYILLGMDISQMSNSVLSIDELMPFYWAALLVFSVFGFLSIAMTFGKIFGKTTFKNTPTGDISRIAKFWLGIACVGAFLAIFAMRFSFYLVHITAGLGV